MSVKRNVTVPSGSFRIRESIGGAPRTQPGGGGGFFFHFCVLRPSLNRSGAAFGRMSRSLPGGAPPAFMVNAPKLQGEVRNVQSLAWSIPPCVSGAARAAARRVRRHDRDRN